MHSCSTTKIKTFLNLCAQILERLSFMFTINYSLEPMFADHFAQIPNSSNRMNLSIIRHRQQWSFLHWCVSLMLSSKSKGGSKLVRKDVSLADITKVCTWPLKRCLTLSTPPHPILSHPSSSHPLLRLVLSSLILSASSLFHSFVPIVSFNYLSIVIFSVLSTFQISIFRFAVFVDSLPSALEISCSIWPSFWVLVWLGFRPKSPSHRWEL